MTSFYADSKRNDTDELVKQTQTSRMNLQVPGGRDSQGVRDGHAHNAVFKVDNK